MTSDSDAKPRPYGITPEWARSTCLMGEGWSCCRYLIGAPAGLECARHTSLGRLIDHRAASGRMTARSVNCPGVGLDGKVVSPDEAEARV